MMMMMMMMMMISAELGELFKREYKNFSERES
jgi:hypothetical protein